MNPLQHVFPLQWVVVNLFFSIVTLLVSFFSRIFADSALWEDKPIFKHKVLLSRGKIQSGTQ